jgi:hypothetical protein
LGKFLQRYELECFYSKDLNAEHFLSLYYANFFSFSISEPIAFLSSS